MNKSNEPRLLDELDPELVGQMVSRRGAFTKAAASLGAVATAPMILAAVSTHAQALLEALLPRQIIDVLNFALTLEYLEDEFYRTALAQPGLIPGDYQNVFRQISKHETEHVGALSTVLGLAATPKPKFDFTARGKYPDVFTNFRTFAALSQTFEDTGVAAYKGQAGNLMGNGLMLTTALRIHSVEGRHAAEVRRIRG
ncbi:MAG TPA: ferritin-like domain-containing protein, partial [Kofleriaceae bacterium]